MKSINEYLKHRALLEKLYTNSLLMPGCKNEYTGVIQPIDEKYVEITFENIDNYITESLSTDFDSCNPQGYWDNIFETLIKSHDAEKLITKLKQYFGEDWIDVEMLNDTKEKAKSFIITVKQTDKNWNIYNYCKARLYKNVENSELPQELTDLMNFFNYYFSKVIPYIANKKIEILCEPKYSNKVNDLVYGKYKGILYHVTNKENVDRILKRGLQLRGNKNLYRYIEPRINFFLANTDNEIEKISKKIAEQKGYKENSYSILKIDLNYGKQNKYNKSSYSLDFYHDNMYKEEYSVYTYGLVHPRFITEYQSLNEAKGEDIDEQWLNDEKPVMTHDGRQVIITKIDYEQIPNIIYGQVKMKEKLFDYEWNDDGMCTKAVDQMGNPKKPDEADKLVKAS